VRGERHESLAVAGKKRTTTNEKRTYLVVRHGRERWIKAALNAHIQKKKFQSESAGSLLQISRPNLG
jgi:hypothetical protein